MRVRQILAAEDDDTAIQPIRARLELRGEFRVDVVRTADDALQRIVAAIPDALLLDTTLPDMPAQELCRALRSRARTANLPCIVLGSANGAIRTVDALSFGADDFMAKPADPIELEARLRALLRRRAPVVLPVERYDFRGRHIDANFTDVAVSVDGTPVSLTRRELLLLRALVEECNHTLSREALLARVWGSASWDCRVVDSAMWKLRRKLGSAGNQIETIVGFGYRFFEPQKSERGKAS